MLVCTEETLSAAHPATPAAAQISKMAHAVPDGGRKAFGIARYKTASPTDPHGFNCVLHSSNGSHLYRRLMLDVVSI